MVVGGRQNNYNNNANQNNNQRYNNNKKQYNNQKMNHHHHNQQQPQQQYVNYPYNTAAAAASQMYGYYMGGYQPVYGLPLQYGGIPATPGQQYPGQVASPVVPTVQPQQISTPPTPKIRLTTKDGKPVDLDEKKEKQHRRLLSHLLNQPGPPQFQVKRIKHLPPVQPCYRK